MKLHSLVRVFLVTVSALLFWGCSAESKRERMLERAAGYFAAGELEKARIEYQNVLQGDPDNVTANERMALIWLERGSPMRAAGYLSKMKTIAPGNLDLRLKLARIMLSLGNANEARREAALIIERSASFPDALVLLSESVRTPEDFRQAEQVLEKVTEKASVPYLIASANLASLRGDAAAARAAYQRAVAREPKSVEARLALAAFLAAQNNPVEARAEFKLAAETTPPNANARLKYAAYLSQTGSIPEAVTYLTEMTRQLPDFLPAWRALAQLAIAERKFDDAQARIQTILIKEPFDYEARILRARLSQAQGDAKRAIEDLEKFGQDFPGLGIEKHQLALAYLQNNDQPAAIKALQETVGRNPDNLEALLLLAQLSIRTGAAQPAAIAMAELVTRRPTFVPAYPVLIDAMRALGRLDQAAVALERGITANPKNFQLHYLLGMVRNQLKQPAEARQSFEATLAVVPDHQGAITELAVLDMNEGKSAAALQRANELIAKSPNSAAAWFVQARVYATQKEWNQAESALHKALEIDPGQPAVYGLLADSFRARKDDPATPGRVDGLLAKRPGDELAAVVAAQFYAQIGQAGKARDIYEAFVAAKPGAALVLNNLANLYADPLKDFDRALETARKARAVDPTAPAIADTLGWMLYQKKAYAEALPLIREGADKLGQLGEVQYHLGMVNLRLGNDEAARTALRLAAAGTANYAGKDEAQRELAELEKRLPTKAQ